MHWDAAEPRVLLGAWLFLSGVGVGCSPPPGPDESNPAQPVSTDIVPKKLPPFPADLGPLTIGLAPGQVPDAERGGYSLVLSRCGKCHTPSRALNHRYAEPEGRDVPDKEAAIASLKNDHPEFFKEPFIWQVEADVWKLCVSRMSAKPSADIPEGDQRAIRLFLSWDSSQRKLGKKAAGWRSLRRSLLGRFKARHPGRYAELEKSDAL